ncbi:MAG: nicotinamide mononucleotide transporter [Bacteroidales bacterium]|nr:nicotinamide mononucleotide transporter [Bacteroidales bacterium]
MDWMNITLFTINGDTPVLLLDLLCSLLGLSCVFLAGRGSKYNFWVGYLYSLALFFLFLNKNIYANMILQPVSIGINVIGHYRWTHPRKGEESSSDRRSLKVTSLTWMQRLLAVCAVFSLAWLWGWLLGRFADPVPYLDACLTILILTAQTLSALKKWDCWVAWLVVNVVQITLHLSVGHIFMSIVSLLYLVNGVISLNDWYKKYLKDVKH